MTAPAMILYRDTRGVATITLNRPQLHNAFDDALIDELTDTLRRLAADPDLRVLVLAAAGRSFSAGADLDWMRRMAGYTEAENLRDAEALATLMHMLDRFPRPTIARVQGSAFGGGVGLIACCDIAIAAAAATFRLSEVRLGLIPAVIGPYVVQTIGARQARRYFLTAESFTAARAQQIGLIHEIVSDTGDAALDDEVARAVDTLLQAAPGAQQAAKELVFLCTTQADPAILMTETARRIATRRVSPEGIAGLHAFLTKTMPPWQQG